MDEVYVIVVSWQRDSGECGINVDVYETLEDAKQMLQIEKESAINDFSDLGDNLVVEEEEWTVCVYEKEEYCYNHCDIRIYQRDVIKLEEN